jgi:3-methyladenine DNA glycosylase Tag
MAYHDTEWGVPLHDERALFEFLILEGAQAGLSWSTILKKREGYRRAYNNFDVERMASRFRTLGPASTSFRLAPRYLTPSAAT